MNRSELIEAVAERAGSDPAAARRHVDAVFDAIMDRVAAGERVLVTGFGTFDRLSRPARTARNPRTGLPVEVAATEVPRFRVGQTFRQRVARSAPAVETVSAVAVGEVVEVGEPSPNGQVIAEPPRRKAKKGKKAAASAAPPKKGKKKPAAKPAAKSDKAKGRKAKAG